MPCFCFHLSFFSSFCSDQASDVIAIDDVNVVDKPCETGFFVIHDYSKLIATAQKGDYLYSPLMYTDDGYGFQIKVKEIYLPY